MLAKRSVCSLLIVLVGVLPAGPVRAGMISVEAAMVAPTLMTVLARPDVAAQLAALGVDRSFAEQRIAAMTDAEALELASALQLAPAGGDYGGGGGGGGGLGALLIIVLVVVLIVWLVNRKPS